MKHRFAETDDNGRKQWQCRVQMELLDLFDSNVGRTQWQSAGIHHADYNLNLSTNTCVIRFSAMMCGGGGGGGTQDRQEDGGIFACPVEQQVELHANHHQAYPFHAPQAKLVAGTSFVSLDKQTIVSVGSDIPLDGLQWSVGRRILDAMLHVAAQLRSSTTLLQTKQQQQQNRAPSFLQLDHQTRLDAWSGRVQCELLTDFGTAQIVANHITMATYDLDLNTRTCLIWIDIDSKETRSAIRVSLEASMEGFYPFAPPVARLVSGPKLISKTAVFQNGSRLPIYMEWTRESRLIDVVYALGENLPTGYSGDKQRFRRMSTLQSERYNPTNDQVQAPQQKYAAEHKNEKETPRTKFWSRVWNRAVPSRKAVCREHIVYLYNEGERLPEVLRNLWFSENCDVLLKKRVKEQELWIQQTTLFLAQCRTNLDKTQSSEETKEEISPYDDE